MPVPGLGYGGAIATRVILVRHAQAGDRLAGHRDLYRPLSPDGHVRAQDLAVLLAPVGPSRILSSPATRCVQTVQPLAQNLGLEVETQPDLWEGTPTAHVLAVLTQHDESTLVACSHGDIIPAVVEMMAADGADVRGRGCEKGSIWLADHDGERWTWARYVDRSQTELPALSN
ncbi:MAG: phosphoglycerate mutase family protein [Actinomycetota bacterium]